ncbi:DUF550 domain-containing protein [Salmonella enterica subsp. enterica serovar Curacao]|nr:DUF550 domain-containing protein [Salmonella enterica subsp. enterica serovar Curacao]EDR5661787.1 DUF550 domain-containing protein [Salmonella enterica]EHZ3869843.1 DUF550 domain-containing protein [Salmonella enterica]EKK5764311.1 DUF550 domain-containing protein [Salmonella enterica]
MTTITKERLLKIQHWRETYGADSNVMLPAEEAAELARIVLAALTAEPVRYLNKFSGTCVTLEQQPNAADDVAVYIPLYTTPPVPERERIRREHAEWSDKTFGDVGPVGPLKHLSKEALEAAADPSDPLEWADMQFLLWDAQRRAGITDEQIALAMVEKLAVNKKREWPEPKDGEPRLHIKEQSVPVVPPEPTENNIPFWLNGEKRLQWLEGAKWMHKACRAAMLQGSQPVSQTYKLPELIEGMEVSVDVSTCDFDAGHRYFGTVTEVSELDSAKNGYILLVQDAKPNFDVNGNSPVIPDGWISCSERMPVIGELNWRTSFPLLITCEIGVIPAYYGFVRVNGNKHYGFMESLKYGDDRGDHPQNNEYGLISNVTHWMPLPEPPI